MKAYTQAVAFVALLAPFWLGLNMKLAVFYGVLLLATIGVGLLVHKRQKAAAERGCIVCHEETLLQTETGGQRCTSCGYESIPEASADLDETPQLERKRA